MQSEQIKTLITEKMPEATVSVQGDGYHFLATIVSEQFLGLSLVQRQQLVYKALGNAIQSGDLHAITLKTFSPDEAQDG